MPYDDTTIANMAVGHLGVGISISDIDTDNTAEGIACRRYFTQCRDILLEIKPWDFATVRWTLQTKTFESTDLWYSHWGFRYSMPADCARPDKIIIPGMRVIPNSDSRIPFKVVKNTDGDGGRDIMCDERNAILEGNIKEPDVSEFSATFAEVHALFLAVRASSQLRVDPSIKRTLMQEWSMWLAELSSQNDGQSQPDPDPLSQFQSVRG